MVYFVMAAFLAICATAWAGGASANAVHRLDRFINTAGVMTRIVNVVDAVRMLALWLSPAFAGGDGRGPFSTSTTPTPSRTTPVGRPPGNPAASRSAVTTVTDFSDFEQEPPA